MQAKDFLEIFCQGFEDGYIGIAIDHPSALEYYNINDISNINIPRDKDVYFTPAIRKEKGAEKEDVLGTKVLWVDVDENTRKPNTLIPPSLVVNSGHGLHLYWILSTTAREIKQLENWNRALVASTQGGDVASWNCNRVLRVPGSSNNKDKPARVQVVAKSSREYGEDVFNRVVKLGKKTLHKILTGDRRGYKSRSERDWAVISALISAGYDDEGITQIFDQHAVGDKYRKDGTKYLERTIEKARESPVTDRPADMVAGIVEREDGYYMQGRRGARRISTFTLDPKVLVDGSLFEAPDALSGTIKAEGYEWPDTTFTRNAFTTVRAFDKESPLIAWQWLGSEQDLRALLPFLLSKLKEKADVDGDFPRVMGSTTIGLHKVEDRWFFVTDKYVMSHNKVWKDVSGPMAWIPRKTEHPKMFDPEEVSESVLTEFAKNVWPTLSQTYTPEVLYLMLGWYAAALFKPWLEEKRYRFPTLNVTGIRGGGKTSMIQNIMMPIFGQEDPKSYDSNTTKFVTLALLGSSNSVPIAFSEFRYAAVEKFLRFILLSYDTGHDPRGRADQTTVDYPLSAPFSLDGEDLVVDPAAQQRIVVARLNPRVVEEGSTAHKAYAEVLPLLEGTRTFAASFIKMVLSLIETREATKVLKRSSAQVFEKYPSKLPDRVRRNHVVVHFGLSVLFQAMGLPEPNCDYLEPSLSAVFDMESGRARTLSDEFVEDVVNACAAGYPAKFRWSKSTDQNTELWFQLSTTHNWWIGVRRGRGKSSLERDAIADQLQHSDYYIGREVKDRVWMYGVNLTKAMELGLDVPSELGKRTIGL